MTSSYLYSILLKVKQFFSKLWGKRELLDAIACFFTEVIGYLEIDIIRGDVLIRSPTIINHINELFCNVNAVTVFPAILEPIIKFTGLVFIGKLRI